MKIINTRGIPDPFVRAVRNDPYSSGNSDFTATSLAAPARQSQLIRDFGPDIEIEAISRFAAVLGQATHSILERAARPIDVIERRFFHTIVVDGVPYLLSAQIDLYEPDTETLYDWKTTKAWAFSKKCGSGKKIDWVCQLNVARWLMQGPVSHLKIIGLLKDFDQKQASKNGYPSCEVVEAELPIWSHEETLEYIESRIRAHTEARNKLPLCTSKETWGGNRCKSYCDAASVCDQYKQAKITGLMPEEREGDAL